MKIELKDGTVIHVSDSAELAEVLRILGLDQRRETKPVSPEAAPPIDESIRVGNLIRSVNPNARKFMTALLGFPKGVRGDKFAEVSGFKPEKFGGIMGGIQKLAEGQKLKRNQFIISRQKIEGMGRFRWLEPGPLLVKYELLLRKIYGEKETEREIISVGA